MEFLIEAGKLMVCFFWKVVLSSNPGSLEDMEHYTLNGSGDITSQG